MKHIKRKPKKKTRVDILFNVQLNPTEQEDGQKGEDTSGTGRKEDKVSLDVSLEGPGVRSWQPSQAQISEEL